MPELLSDKIQEFIDWLAENTDFGDWDVKLQDRVHKQLITIMISDRTKEREKDQGENR